MDTGLRALRRATEGTTDGPAWLRLAFEAARAGAFDEAGRAALVAEAFGDTSEVLDVLAPPADAFRCRNVELEVPRGFEWTPDGRGFVGVVRAGPAAEVVLIDATSGERHVVLRSSSRVDLARTVLGLHPTGRRVALTYQEPGGQHVLSTVDVASSELEPEIARRASGWDAVALTGANHLVAAAAPSVQIHPLDGGWAPLRKKPLFVPRLQRSETEESWLVRLDADGGVLRRLGVTVELFDPGSTARRVRLHVPPLDHAIRARRRLVTVSDRAIRLQGPNGADLGQATRAAEYRGVPEVSPSGRIVALLVRPAVGRPAVVLSDLRNPHHVTTALGADVDPVAAAWSPSGRKLFVWTAAGPSLLYEAR